MTEPCDFVVLCFEFTRQDCALFFLREQIEEEEKSIWRYQSRCFCIKEDTRSD